MPQLDLATFPTQLIWLAVTFAALYLVMAYSGLPRLGGIIERRRARIADDLDKAQRMKAEAEAVIAAYEKALAEARAKAQAVLREATNRLSAEAAAQQKKLAERLAIELDAAEKRIEAAKTKALSGLRELAVDVARAASAKLSGREADSSHVAEAVDAVLKEHA
jgi:F-type H+-transporting ATPase subunit b